MKKAVNPLVYDQAMLARIGSNRDAAMFHAERTMCPSDNTKNRTVIVNYATADRAFGCRFKCSFCSWRDRAIATGDIYPSKEALTAFLADYSGYKVTISGGGDPLFDMRNNLGRFEQLIDWIHELGFLVEVITKETRNVAAARRVRDLMYADDYLNHMCMVINKVDMWSFSFESSGDGNLHDVEATVFGANADDMRQVRVSKVVMPLATGNPDKLLEQVEQYKTFVDKFNAAGAYQVILREDFYQPLTGWPVDSREALMSLRAQRPSAKWLLNKVCSDNLFLINENVHHGDAALGGDASVNFQSTTTRQVIPITAS